MTTTVGEFIRARLGNMKMKELASKAGKNPTYLSRVIKGSVKASPEFLKVIAPHLQDTSLQELMSVAGYLTPEDEPDNESLEQLKVRMADLSKKLAAAIEKYINLTVQLGQGRSSYPYAEIEAQELALRKLLSSVHDGSVYANFGFLENEESLVLIQIVSSLHTKQKEMLIPVLKELKELNELAGYD